MKSDNLVDLRGWMREIGGLLVAPNDPEFILQTDHQDRVVEVKKSDLEDSKTLAMNHRQIYLREI